MPVTLSKVAELWDTDRSRTLIVRMVREGEAGPEEVLEEIQVPKSLTPAYGEGYVSIRTWFFDKALKPMQRGGRSFLRVAPPPVPVPEVQPEFVEMGG